MHALIVEDDTRLAALLAEYLEGHGVIVSLAHDGLDGLEQALSHRFDVVLLDLMLPGLDGLSVCSRLRARSDVPILVITARDAEHERIAGLDCGADDYICKPFSSPELLARMRAVARRHRGTLTRTDAPVSVGALSLDPNTRAARLHDQPLTLTALEFELLLSFARNAGKTLSREHILELVHGTTDTAFDRSIDGHISRLRRKLGDDPRRPTIIQTARRAGYLFNPPGPRP